MRCTSPRTVGFLADGKTITWSQKHHSKEYASFQLPCGKCLECRLEYARSWAVRCVHEAQMHENNCFITLTYDSDHLKNTKLQYIDFQLFIKRLRKKIYDGKDPIIRDKTRISVFATGEYGEINKRPHWHACIFNWSPPDAKKKYISDRGDQVYSSEILDTTWGNGITEFGAVTFESAGYCARYAAKKLVHGKDDDHEYHPISKKSSKNAIGKSWLEKYWPDVFNSGLVRFSNGTSSAIPRYYEKWLKTNHPDAWENYIKKFKYPKIEKANAVAEERKKIEIQDQLVTNRKAKTMQQMQKVITEANFKRLQERLKI